MSNKISLLTIASALALFTFSSCKKDLQQQALSTETEIPDFSENGTNPDEQGLADQTARYASTGYLYTEGNEAGMNYIHIFKQHGDGHLTKEGMVASGGAGNRPPSRAHDSRSAAGFDTRWAGSAWSNSLPASISA